jgi:biopolymer transport protein ExbD
MRLELSEHDEGHLPVVPLIDVMVFLLLFFLAATTIARKEVEMDLNLPHATAGKKPRDEHLLVINVARDGAIRLDGKAVTFEALKQKLHAAAARKKEQAVLIRGDTDSRFGTVAQVFDACLAASLKFVSIGALPAVPDGAPVERPR